MSLFYEEISDLNKYSNHRRLFWKFFRCMCKHLEQAKRKEELEYPVKFKMFSHFINSVIHKSLPWENFCEAYSQIMSHHGGLTSGTDISDFMTLTESFFETIPHDYENVNKNLQLTASECFTILFLFTVKVSEEQLSVIKILPRILICLNSNPRFISSMKRGMEVYSFSDESKIKLSDDVTYLIQKCVANIRGMVDIENSVIRAGIYNDLCNTHDIEGTERSISEDKMTEMISGLHSKIGKDKIVQYFQERVYKPCDVEVVDNRDNRSSFENVLFHSPVKKAKVHCNQIGTDSTLPVAFGFFQIYSVNEVYPPSILSRTKEYIHFFRNTTL